MTTKEFLTENKSEVIIYFNEKVKGYYNTDLKSFMTDLLVNFRKVTISEGLKRMDLFSNLDEAKSRLGLMSQNNFEYATDKRSSDLSKKYAGTAYMSMI